MLFFSAKPTYQIVSNGFGWYGSLIGVLLSGPIRVEAVFKIANIIAGTQQQNNHVNMNDNNNHNNNNHSSSGINDIFGNQEDECFYNFESFVDPSMLLPEDVDFSALSASDLAIMDSIPSLPSEIPSAIIDSGMMQLNSPSKVPGPGPGSLYEKLTSTPSTMPASPTMAMSSSPNLYPYGSPYSMGSPSSLMMSTANNINSMDTSWMHSNRPRRRRSNYSSPTLMSQAPVSQYFNAFGYMPYGGGSPMMASSQMYAHPHAPYMMAAPMSPLNVTVKLPMAPLTPTNFVGNRDQNGSMKIPLVLPCHLQQEQAHNGAAPNISKLQTTCSASSTISSGVPSRCSSIAPNSSISSRSTTSSLRQQNWFTEMSATKDRFLKDVDCLDFTNVTVLQLKQILRRFGLNSTGKKAQLVERITEISGYLKREGMKRVKLSKSSQIETESVVSSGLSSVSNSNSSIISAAVA